MKACPALLLVALAASACVDTTPLAPPASPANDMNADPVSLRIALRDPAGAFVCDGLPAGTEIDVGLIDEFNPTSWSSASLICPARFARFTVDPDTRYTLFMESRDPAWTLPRFHARRDTIQVASDTALGLRVKQGRPLGGVATMRGIPHDGESLLSITARVGFLDGMELSGVDSDSLGRWVDSRTGLPLHLQTGIAYARSCTAGLGMRVLSGPDPEAYEIYPAEWGAVNCRFGNSLAEAHTHRATNLQVTPEAGVIDPWIGDDENGYGFGVAYPTGGALTLGQSLLQEAALIYTADGLGPIWTPWDRADLTGCNSTDPVDCGMYVKTAGPIVNNTAAGRRVRFALADSGAGPASFEVRQASWDGAHGDYILYRVSFLNLTEFHRTVYPAWYLDWAVTGEYGDDDVADVSPDGRLIWVTDGDRYVGSYIVSPHPAVSRWFGSCCGIAGASGSMAAAEDILRGFLISTNDFGPADVAVSHGTRLQVPAGATRHFWFALVAGGSVAEIQNAASQAQQEADERRPD